MKIKKLVVDQSNSYQQQVDSGTSLISYSELEHWVKTGKYFRKLFSYSEVVLSIYRLDIFFKPFTTCAAIWLLAWRKATLVDQAGNQQNVDIVCLLKKFFQFLNDWIFKSKLLSSVEHEVTRFDPKNITKTSLNLLVSPIYIRTDLWFGVRAGGSVGHIAGVLNNLDSFTGKPIFLTSDEMPTIRQDIDQKVVRMDGSFCNFREISSFRFTNVFFDQALKQTNDSKISFVYQRYSLNNYSGLKLARHYNVPFVLEYNGSEIWINRNWGKPLTHEDLSQKIELLNLNHADSIVVVSQPMKDELETRGIESDKILVNPNGVDPIRYTPDINGIKIRDKYQLNSKIVIGFIGTFGPWHGAEVLTDAFGQLLNQFPAYRDQLRLLMIGDGAHMSVVKESLSRHQTMDECVLTGIVPQEEGPECLAACDILASPHVPNKDGTPFFGSPTKLFEYMAMGKAIVASDLNQVGEILSHRKTALLVKPGDTNALAAGIKDLIENSTLRNQLGKAARKEVLAKYTWHQHTTRIINHLVERCG